MKRAEFEELEDFINEIKEEAGIKRLALQRIVKQEGEVQVIKDNMKVMAQKVNYSLLLTAVSNDTQYLFSGELHTGFITGEEDTDKLKVELDKAEDEIVIAIKTALPMKRMFRGRELLVRE